MEEGWIDMVTPEGVVQGWCWNRSFPKNKSTIIVAVDGLEVARVVADLYRADLEEAGIGDGYHAFQCILPLGRLEQSRAHQITIIDVVTGKIYGKAYEFQSQPIIAFDDRLYALETRAALLEGRLNELRRPHISDVEATELFAIVGSFFERLSKDIAHGGSLNSERQLGDNIRALSKAYPPILFPQERSPLLSVVIEAADPFGQIYTCLDALRRATMRFNAQVTVLDTGVFEENALLPSLVRGIRYIRTDHDLVSEWIGVERDENYPFLIILNGQTIVKENFVDSLMEWFDSHPRSGAVGGCVVGADGTIRHGGLCLFDDKIKDCADVGHPDKRVDVTICHPVHALSSQAAAFHRNAVKTVGGPDPIFGDDLGAAVIDLCFRLREHGWSVESEPRAKIQLPPQPVQRWITPALTAPCAAGDLLFQRWLDPSAKRPAPLIAGIAAIFSRVGHLREEIEAIHCLRDARYAVVYIYGDEQLGDAAAVRNAGATIQRELAGGGDAAPSLVFVAVQDELADPPVVKPKRATIVSGLDDLKLCLRSQLTFSDAG